MITAQPWLKPRFLIHIIGATTSSLNATGRPISRSCLPCALCCPGGAFDYALTVTTICFVDDIMAMMTEAYRVLKPGGGLVIGFIDRESGLGRHYVEHQHENVFYRGATFYSAEDVERFLNRAGFSDPVWVQTLMRPLEQTHEIEAVRDGRGQGAFVVVKAVRP